MMYITCMFERIKRSQKLFGGRVVGATMARDAVQQALDRALTRAKRVAALDAAHEPQVDPPDDAQVGGQSLGLNLVVIGAWGTFIELVTVLSSMFASIYIGFIAWLILRCTA